jgi:hypothetical protein
MPRGKKLAASGDPGISQSPVAGAGAGAGAGAQEPGVAGNTAPTEHGGSAK